jgi:eukaryotic-like serine/threonine-protein kinase
MTNPPQNPFGYNPFGNDPFGGAPFGSAPSGPPVYSVPPPPPPPPDRRPTNTFANLSLIFAFVFAPAGAILGHLGLAQIRRSGERGRDRALVGVTFSYAFITLAVIALVVWAIRPDATPHRSAAHTAAAGAPPASAPPTVAPSDLGGLMPRLEDVKTMTGDQNLIAGEVTHQPKDDTSGETLDRPECWGSLNVGVPNDYSGGALLGYYMPEFLDSRDPFNAISVAPAAAAFLDAPTAQAQLTKLSSGWRKCGGSNLKVTTSKGLSFTFTTTGPTDVGNGITTMQMVPQGLPQLSVHAIAAKANVVVDVLVSYTGTAIGDRAQQTTLLVTNYILGKIPG